MEEEVSKHKHRVIVGLGNPGLSYANTRHNLGKLIVLALASHLNWTLKKDPRNNVEDAKGILDGVNVHLVLPTLYMNESGSAIRKYLSYYRLSVDDLIVVNDDVALPFGSLRIREGGSSGGHNGLKSIEEHLGTQKYLRLRVGVGQPFEGQDLADYVLGKFTQDEASQLPKVLEKGTEALQQLTKHTVELAMNLVNIKNVSGVKS
ncbi:MAG: aminoacyl-tRNA hydrolase [Parachlamydiales bacterium]|jgi:PTH1 family peptidyl-tRNA hydrolase